MMTLNLLVILLCYAQEWPPADDTPADDTLSDNGEPIDDGGEDDEAEGVDGYEIPDPCPEMDECWIDCSTVTCPEDYGEDVDCSSWCLDPCEICFADRLYAVEDLLSQAWDEKDAVDAPYYEAVDSADEHHFMDRSVKHDAENEVEELQAGVDAAQSKVDYYLGEEDWAKEDKQRAKMDRATLETRILIDKLLEPVVSDVETYDAKYSDGVLEEVDAENYGGIYSSGGGALDAPSYDLMDTDYNSGSLYGDYDTYGSDGGTNYGMEMYY
eukprot:GHVH01004786.1.p1 GENE.GHVH01004786.1~~GHVH01004786.1.p1  ORF type:complete len:269 (+),score=58.95 GHVH01004786.1:119-925(+)